MRVALPLEITIALINPPTIPCHILLFKDIQQVTPCLLNTLLHCTCRSRYSHIESCNFYLHYLSLAIFYTHIRTGLGHVTTLCQVM